MVEWNLNLCPYNKTDLEELFLFTLQQSRDVSHTEKQAFVSTVAYSVSLYLKYDCW